jgi:curli production assembly/transport component CsgG
MKRTIIALSVLAALSGCSTLQRAGKLDQAPVVTKSMMQREFDVLPAPASGKPVSVAVYSFLDKTGQRRPTAGIASLSTAVTQGGETFLIQALQNVGRGQWFDVVERVGIDNLTKERTIIRQMREAYEGPTAKPLMPMQFAGMIIEGGIIGYDSSTKSGGVGARWLGIGASTQYSEDIVTVSLRAVSVQTGKVLLSVTVQKTILSSADSVTALKFFDAGTKAFEGEIGMTINEPGTYAVKSATEAAVVELIKEGQRKGVWSFKEEKTNVLVQPQAPEAPASAPVTPAPLDESSKQESNAGSKEQSTKEEVIQPVKITVTDVTEKVEAVLKQTDTGMGLIPKAGKPELKGTLPDKRTMYLNQDAYVYKEPNEKSQRTWQLKKGQAFTVEPQATIDGWVFVRTVDGKKGFVRDIVLTPDTPTSK